MDFLNHLSPHGHYFLKLIFNSMRKKIPILILFFLVFTNTTNGAEKINIVENKPELYFVYNANSGFINGLIDYTHKIVSPETYTCNLCALTYNNLGILNVWEQFIEKLEFPVYFEYRDTIDELLPGINNVTTPFVALKREAEMSILISAQEINNLKSIHEFIELVSEKTLEL